MTLMMVDSEDTSDFEDNPRCRAGNQWTPNPGWGGRLTLTTSPVRCIRRVSAPRGFASAVNCTVRAGRPPSTMIIPCRSHRERCYAQGSEGSSAAWWSDDQQHW